MCISGATGINAAYVNGLYEVTDEVSGRMPVYKKQGDDMWLEYHSLTTRWMLRATAYKGQKGSGCTAFVLCDSGLVLPDKPHKSGRSWHVLVSGNWDRQAGISVIQTARIVKPGVVCWIFEFCRVFFLVCLFVCLAVCVRVFLQLLLLLSPW